MISLIFRWINKLFDIALIICCVAVVYKYKCKEDVVIEQNQISVVESTYSYGEKENIVIKTQEVILQDDVYESQSEWEYKYPDIDLPDVDGIKKDAYGNYIITQEMFLSKDSLPFNESGYIDYVFYYDYNGNTLNPMPKIYNDYLYYFNLDGG